MTVVAQSDDTPPIRSLTTMRPSQQNTVSPRAAVTAAPERLAGALAGPLPIPRLLGHAGYSVLVTAAGTGRSTFTGIALNPWRADRVEDPDGIFIYLRDLDSRFFWSAGYQPTRRAPERYDDEWQPGVYSIRRLDDAIETFVEICVVPDTPVELRRLTLHNRADRRRRIEITSLVEIALSNAAAHAAHPVFSKLFVQTEAEPKAGTLLATRRARSADERHPSMWHALRIDRGWSGGAADLGFEYETDRARFIGRGHDLTAPQALMLDAPLSGTTGNVLDPIFSLRRGVTLPPGGEVRVTLVLGAAPGRAAALALARRFADADTIEAGFVAARGEAARELARLGIDPAEAVSSAALAAAALYGSAEPGDRAVPREPSTSDWETLARHGLSAARPLAVLHADAARAPDLIEFFVRAAAYWHSLGCPIDTVSIALDSAAKTVVSGAARRLGMSEHLPVLERDELAETEIALIDLVARLVIRDHLPDLGGDDPARIDVAGEAVSDDDKRRGDGGETRPERVTKRRTRSTGRDRPASGDTNLPRRAIDAASTTAPLRFDNGYGGFTADGDEYVIRLPRRADGGLTLPPRPWVNVIANRRFGCLVSETGAGTTWSRNSREFRLTPWSNDPVLDPHGEAFYVRDEESGEFWSLLPGPAPLSTDHEARHGLGVSLYRAAGRGLEQTTTILVARDDPLRITRVRLSNVGERRRCLSVFAYYRLVLGTSPEESSRFIVTAAGRAAPEVFARNPLAGPYAGETICAGVALSAAASDHLRATSWTADRAAFIGRYGDPARPRALVNGATLDGACGAHLDPCIAQQLVLDLPVGASIELGFLLGAAGGDSAAQALLDRYRSTDAIDQALCAVRTFWTDTVCNVQIETPSPALDLLVNRWLPYQISSCRLWGRSAFYQSGGACGFRDQLQDAASLVHALPEQTRAQLLLHAAQQFPEGDVLHWWHPPHGAGIRTRFADDRLWLPYLTAHYVRTTGDWEVLDQPVHGIEARHLAVDEDEAYLQPRRSAELADLYERCCRALDCSLTRGERGLPLFGTGDWNDGMNRVGRRGRGESVWLGFFTDVTLAGFLPICERRGDTERVRRYQDYRAALRHALNDTGWDGAWYRRGYYDDGTPLGSQASDECRIDGLVQAWAILSGVAPRARAASAMQAVEEHLVREEDRLIRLLTPPFESTPHDPGYIRGYVRGVRENGGQYTHAALWMVQALFELGERERAARWLDLLNPILHAQSRAGVAVYQVEPYVVAADVYGEPPHVGRGGWTWYTGAAGWMLRVTLESLLGVRLTAGSHLLVAPRVPDTWRSFTVRYRLPASRTVYAITARHPGDDAAEGVIAAALDGNPLPIEDGACRVPVVRDERTHRVELELGPRPDPGERTR